MNISKKPKYIIDPISDCWIWQRCLINGYGQTIKNGKRIYAHRLSYEEKHGPIPVGLTLDHLCRTPRCINPLHLEPVSLKENLLRGISPAAINARKTHCIRNHKFTKENTIKEKNKHRRCRKCKVIDQIKYKSRRKLKEKIHEFPKG